MSKWKETFLSQGSMFLTYYYHYIQNRPEEVYKLVEKYKKKIIQLLLCYVSNS